jgi:uncharacterized protein
VQYPDYDPRSPLSPLQPDEIVALDSLLQRLPADGTMSLDGLDGYLTALAIGPAALRALPTADWLPLIWGGDPDGVDLDEGAAPSPAPFSSRRQRKDTVVRVLRHLRHLQHQLQHATADWEPIFSIAEQGADEWVDARDWCTGFLQAVDLLPQSWGDVWAEATVQPLLALGGGLQGSAAEAGAADGVAEAARDEPPPDDLRAIDEMSRAVPDAVLHLMVRLQAPGLP